ncbi:ring-opening amidohydrolase [Roseisalinus antarcticus]|uniref:Cyanuric acid amidohydrolase n=1 Tax=Roseisalinus antarcticus TaxID=254357 RepID=A0A1Y5REP8_9RHOB|nr:ring-opening amidohydrolase [Roseisalinus antarcticus]SLN14831.1 Cyanuric acid amidohydrolase [Roseisalinus antarcticus]
MARQAEVTRLPMAAPDDVSAIAAAIHAGRIAPDRIVAVLAKTEGNGCVNDFSRGLSVMALRALLAPFLPADRLDALPLVMSGGTEGGLSPHWILFHETGAEAEHAPDAPPALAMASALTRPLHPSEIGRPAQAELVRDAVARAIARAEIAGPEDVHYVQVKCPLLTAARVAEAKGDVATDNMLKSMGLSRGASALGVALALNEVDTLPHRAIGHDLALWSARASCSAGIELTQCEVVVLGHSAAWTGPLRIAHAVMQDAIDAPAVAGLLETVAPGAGLQQAAPRIRAVLAKAEASSFGAIRGARHTMLDDSDISSTRHARGFVGGLLAGLVGRTELFVSGGAEHQGPDGGGPVALIYES